MPKLKFRPALIILLAILLGFGCSAINPFAAEDFNKFYSKFHSDSTFQLSRIHFPIKGILIDGEGKHQWSKQNWTLLTIPVSEVDTTNFEVELKKEKESFTQRSWIKNSGFETEFRFGLRKRKWYLVYALEQNL